MVRDDEHHQHGELVEHGAMIRRPMPERSQKFHHA
jgi:hypothetical protein